MEDPGTPRKFVWMNLESQEDLEAFRAAMLRRLGPGKKPPEEVILSGATDGGLDWMEGWGAGQIDRSCSMLARLMPRHSCEGDEFLDGMNPLTSREDLERVLEAAWENREGYGVLELSVSGEGPEQMRLAAADLLDTARSALLAGDPMLSPEVSLQNRMESDREGDLRYTERHELRLHLRRPDMPGLIDVIVRDEDALHLGLMEEGEGENAASGIPEMEIGLGAAYGEMNRN